ncbi:hypothetical protein [Rhizobium ruizarguesonis]|uniref:hypothetical protein n=1 Tax=Rhizobium ruizarguesonis TaxID=2081791 RepID=UPI0010326659|nr:hypothetical protein [Rhizobium ruizarguesonis]TBC68717.1 hypothetical protein ELH30_31535 [Rhizobium ruizarguesonis]
MSVARRRLLIGGLCLCGTAIFRSVSAKSDTNIQGEGQCFFDSAVSQAAAGDIRNSLYRHSSGDPGRDQTVSDLLFRTARTYDIAQAELPTFRFIPVTVKGDGFATDETVEPDTKGLVALNLRLLSAAGADMLPITGFEVILAHEFAHIFQIRNRDIEKLQNNGYHSREIELHADYMAGWCISQRGELTTAALQGVAETLFSRGDKNPDVTLHHGTKTERISAVLKGYLSGGSTDVARAASINGMGYINSL